MAVMRLLPAFMFVVLLGTQMLFLSDRAYAGCSCYMACPSPRCPNCDPYCAVGDSFKNYHNTKFQIRSVHSPLFTTDAAGNDLPRVVTLLATPQAFVKLQCQRIKEMLNWASDLYMKGPESQRALQ